MARRDSPVRIGSSSFHLGTPHTEQQWERAARQLMEEGQAFLAQDLALSGLQRFPENPRLMQVHALALTRTGALDEARRILESLCPEVLAEREALAVIHSRLQALGLDLAQGETSQDPASELLEQLLESLHQLKGERRAGRTLPVHDEETLGLLGRVYKDLWRISGDEADAKRARDIYRRGFRETRGIWTGINLATMSWLVGDHAAARTVAGEVLALCQEAEVVDYWQAANKGEALLLLGRREQAVEAYREAVDLAADRHSFIPSTLKQLRLLKRHGFKVPRRLFQILRPPTIVVFAGHMIDSPGRGTVRFPESLERAVSEQIDAALKDLEPRFGHLIGYCGAACGSDILFVEAMKRRGAEVNIILPFDIDDFIQTSVQHAGRSWVARFQTALKVATTVKYVTDEPYLGDDELFVFAGRIHQGYATLRANTLQAAPSLLAVIDHKSPRLAGGTRDIVSQWQDKQRLRTIDLGCLRGGSAPASETPQDYSAVTPAAGGRVVRTLLFGL